MSTYFSAGVSPFTAGVGEAPVCCLVGGRSVFTHRFRRPPGRSLAHARLWRPVCSSRLAGSVSAAPRRGACWWCFEMVAAASPRCMVRYDRRSCAVIRRYWRRYHSIVRSSPSRSDIVGSKSNCSVTFEVSASEYLMSPSRGSVWTISDSELAISRINSASPRIVTDSPVPTL